MNNKGFSLIELLAVISIMALIIVISVPLSGVIKDGINEYMLEQKIKLIEKDAILYGEDYINDISSSTKKYNNYKCIIIEVKDLVPLYLDSETENDNCYTGGANTGCIKDNTSDKYLDQNKIIIYEKNSKVHAEYVKGNNNCK